MSKPRSEDGKKNIAIGNRNKNPNNVKYPTAKQLLNLETGIFYRSASEASFASNIPSTTFFRKLEKNKLPFIYV